MPKNIAWVAGICGQSFLAIRCWGRGTSLAGNDDERECVCLWVEVWREGGKKNGSIEMVADLCPPCFVYVEFGGGLDLIFSVHVFNPGCSPFFSF